MQRCHSSWIKIQKKLYIGEYLNIKRILKQNQ